MSRINDHEVNLVKNSKLKILDTAIGIERTGNTYAIGGDKSITDLAKQEAIEKYDDKVEEYTKKLEAHSNLLEEYRKSIAKDLEHLEIKSLFEGVIIKPYAENPFQQIKKEGTIITDLGGQKPVYKSHETGEWEEEESFIHVGLVVDAGPTCKFVQEGDVVFWRKVSETPIPFFKQNLVLVNEHSLIANVNQGLTERYKKYQND